MSPNKTVSRTAKTESFYIKRAHLLLSQIQLSNLEHPEIGVSPMEAVNFFKQKAKTIRKSTFQVDRAALIFYFESMADQYPDAGEEYRNGAAALRTIKASVAKKRCEADERSSSNKAKHIPMDDIAKLANAMLYGKRGFWAPRAFTWLSAGIASGLRPIEWATATICEQYDDGSFLLRVQNAKNTNGRSTGPTREVKVAAGWQANYVINHMRYLKRWSQEGGEFEFFYEQCRRALTRTVRRIWPNDVKRRYTLYSGRHQFCANLKRSGLSKREIADMMGHLSNDTAGRHYGKRRSGHGSFSILSTELRTPTVEKDIEPNIN